jgi:hypothetical protein
MDANYKWTEYVSLEHICDWTSYCTFHSDMDAPWSVHVDVPSDIPVSCIFCYTHHSDMDAPQYVHADVPSDYLCLLMFYYTLHSDMDAPQYVHVNVPSD